MRLHSAADDDVAPAGADVRPLFRVAVFGLAHRFHRLAEIVLRHARHNRYRYELAQSAAGSDFDIAVIDMTAEGGPELASSISYHPRHQAVVRVGRRHDVRRGRDDLLQSGFTANLLNVLNQVVEQALLGRPSRARAAIDAAGGAVSAARRRARALIVDDSATARRQLSEALRKMGIDSDGVPGALEAFDAMEFRSYDLVFVDIVMPRMDGFGLTRELKRDRATRDVPVIILTGRSSPFDLARGALAGCDSYLVKPVPVASLRETVSRLLRLHRPAAAGGFGRLQPI